MTFMVTARDGGRCALGGVDTDSRTEAPPRGSLATIPTIYRLSWGSTVHTYIQSTLTDGREVIGVVHYSKYILGKVNSCNKHTREVYVGKCSQVVSASINMAAPVILKAES